MIKSSWDEYEGHEHNGICDTQPVFQHFKNLPHYKRYAQKTLTDIRDNKKKIKELEEILLG